MRARRIAVLGVVLVLAAVAALVLLRVQHERALARDWRSLQVTGDGERFDARRLAALPAPARRYLARAIAPGTPLARSVELTMFGAIGLAPGADKLPFQARQVLALPEGLIWRARVGDGWLRMVGDDRYVDGRGAMRWFLWELLPLVRADGPHVTRSAAGRVALEAPLFLPSALLGQAVQRWEAIDDRRFRVHLLIGAEHCAPTLSVAADGRLARIEMLRWDADGPDGRPGHVAWLGESLGAEQRFDGYRLPTRLRVTKYAGSARADTFFEAEITGARFR